MLLFILLQFFPLGLTGENNHMPPYWSPGPRNLIPLKSISRIDNTYVKTPTKNCGVIVDQNLDETNWNYSIIVQNNSTLSKRKFIISSEEFHQINFNHPFCVDSLEYW